jgi:hypothetical protein
MASSPSSRQRWTLKQSDHTLALQQDRVVKAAACPEIEDCDLLVRHHHSQRTAICIKNLPLPLSLSESLDDSSLDKTGHSPERKVDDENVRPQKKKTRIKFEDETVPIS